MAKIVHEVEWDRVRADLASSIRAAKEENITLIVYNSDTGAAWRISPDGAIEPYDIKHKQTDWERVQSMTDEEIEAADTSDEGLAEDCTERAVIVRDQRKKR